jgi:predicted DNA-binding transcriptional regulator YafY
MLCTLKADQLPAKFEKAIEGIYRPAVDEDLLPVWDVTEGKWKSFRISKIVSFRTPDELVNNDKEGQDVESSQKEILEKRKQTAKQSFEERVQKQKEQAQKSKENLDKARSIVNKLRGIQNEN